MSKNKFNPFAYHIEEMARLSTIKSQARQALVARLARVTETAEAFTDDPTLEGSELAIEAEKERRAISDLLERTPENMNFHLERTRTTYLKDNQESIIESAEGEKAALVENFPQTEESFLKRIMSATTEAMGRGATASAEGFAKRKTLEENLIFLRSCVERVDSCIARFRLSPDSQAFNDLSGVLGQLRHEISLASKAAAT